MNKHELASAVRATLIEQGKIPKVGVPVEQERGAHYPDMPPILDGENVEQFTQRLLGPANPYFHARKRQCSIGYHMECSQREAVSPTCKCPCHLDREPHSGITATSRAVKFARLWNIPIATGKIVVEHARYFILTAPLNLSLTDEDDYEKVTFSQVQDVIEAARPHYSRPGRTFTLDVINICDLEKHVDGMP